MSAENEKFARPPWYKAAVWMGIDFFGLSRLLMSNGFRVRPGRAPDCLVDVWSSLFNTAMASLQAFRYGPELRRLQLAGDPIFIIGHWRTGTTLLHELLALDRRHRCPTTFECFSPNHFLLTAPTIRWWTDFLLPSTRPIDNMEMGWDKPQEDEFALCNLGIPSPYATMAFPDRPPAHREYLDLDRISGPQRRRWKRALLAFCKQLTLVRRGRLVLKSPPHTCRLPTLLEMFPKACFINMVRSPYKIFLSTVRLWKSLYVWQGYHEPHFADLEEQVFDTFLHMHQRLEATRGLVDPSRFFELKYEDLVRDPLGRMRAMYQHLDLGDFAPVEPRIRGYFEERADYQTNRYETPPELRAEIRRRWGPYFERYGYE